MVQVIECFHFIKNCGINYKGIEKFQEVIQQSNYSNDIYCLDVGSENFINNFREKDKTNYEMIVLFGVINAFIDENLRKNAWKNLRDLMNEDNILVVNTLSHFEWFDNAESGRVIEFPNLPPQYFYSEKELSNIFADNDLELINRIQRRNSLLY